MKVRSGFVSNSSTSSFVIMGFLLSEKKHNRLSVLKALLPDNPDLQKMKNEDDEFTDLWYDLQDETGYCIKSGGDDGIKNNKICIGIEIANFDSECDTVNDSNTNLSKLVKQVNNLRKTLNLSDDEEIKIISGTSAC